MLKKILILFFLIISSCEKVNFAVYNRYKPDEVNETVKQSKEIINKLNKMIKSNNIETIYNLFTPRTKSLQSKQEFIMNMENIITEYGKPENIQILEIHRIRAPAKSNNEYVYNSGKSDYLGDQVAMKYFSSGENMIILSETDIKGSVNKYWFSLNLSKIDNQWLIHGFHITVKEGNGKDGNYYLKKSQKLKNINHSRSAYLYQILGLLLNNPYPNVIEAKYNNLINHTFDDIPDFYSRSEVVWKMTSGNEYIITQLAGNAYENKMIIELNYRTEKHEDNRLSFEEKEQELFSYIKTTYPEFKENFDEINLRYFYDASTYDVITFSLKD